MEKLQKAIALYNESERSLKVENIPEEIAEYLSRLPEDVEITVYKRSIPDLTRTAIHGSDTSYLAADTLPWYKSAPAEEKRELAVKKLDFTKKSGITVNGYTAPLYDSFGSVLGNFVLGVEKDDAELIATGNKIIMDNIGSDMSLEYHDDMKAWAFTDTTPYILWFDYGEYLTPEAKDALYRYIVRMGRKTTGFSPYKCSGEAEEGSFHNQQSEGLLLGLMYAEIAGDDAMLKRMEDAVDRVLSSLAMGQPGDSDCHGYGGFTFFNYYTAYQYTKNERIKAKLDLILKRYCVIIADLFHYPSNSLMGTASRMYGGSYFTNPEKQDYRTILHMGLDGSIFAPSGESIGYQFWNSVRAATELHLPDFMESLVKNRSYPYESTERFSVNNDLSEDAMYAHIGFITPDEKRFVESYTYATEEYSLATSPAQWHSFSVDFQNAVFRSTIRRTDSVEQIKDYSDIGLLWSHYMYDSDIAKNPEVALKWESYNYPMGEGKQFAVQEKNKAILFSWPGNVRSESDPKPASGYTLKTDTVSDMGATILYTNREEAQGIWYGDRFLFGELTLLSDGKKEVRVRLSTSELPIMLKGNETIYIEDNNTYIALTALNTTSLGREYDIGITDMGKAIADVKQGASSATTHNLLAITAYNYYGEKKQLGYEDRRKQRNGFVIELGEKSEYATIWDFKNHIETETELEISDKPGNWSISYTSGADKLSQSLNPDTMQVNEGNRGGKAVYFEDYKVSDCNYAKSTTEVDASTGITYRVWNSDDFWGWLDSEVYAEREFFRSSEAVQSTAKEIKLGEATLRNPDGTSVMLLHEASSGMYLLLNLTDRVSDFVLETPEGKLNVKGLGLGEARFSPRSDTPASVSAVPGMGSGEPACTAEID